MYIDSSIIMWLAIGFVSGALTVSLIVYCCILKPKKEEIPVASEPVYTQIPQYDPTYSTQPNLIPVYNQYATNHDVQPIYYSAQ